MCVSLASPPILNSMTKAIKAHLLCHERAHVRTWSPVLELTTQFCLVDFRKRKR